MVKLLQYLTFSQVLESMRKLSTLLHSVDILDLMHFTADSKLLDIVKLTVKQTCFQQINKNKKTLACIHFVK